MGTTLDHTVGGHDSAGQRYTELVLSARDVLPRGRNGRAPAPADPYAAQVRRDWQQSRSCAFKRERAVLMDDARAGVPLPIVLAPLRQLTTEIETEAAGAARTSDRPMVALLRRETRAQGHLDLAQIRVVHEPECQIALTDVLRAADLYTVTLDDFTSACVRRLRPAEPSHEKGRRTEVRTPLRSSPRGSATSNALQSTIPESVVAVVDVTALPPMTPSAGGAQ